MSWFDFVNEYKYQIRSIFGYHLSCTGDNRSYEIFLILFFVNREKKHTEKYADTSGKCFDSNFDLI